jgi:hypothetical protein
MDVSILSSGLQSGMAGEDPVDRGARHSQQLLTFDGVAVGSHFDQSLCQLVW